MGVSLFPPQWRECSNKLRSQNPTHPWGPWIFGAQQGPAATSFQPWREAGVRKGCSLEPPLLRVLSPVGILYLVVLCVAPARMVHCASREGAGGAGPAAPEVVLRQTSTSRSAGPGRARPLLGRWKSANAVAGSLSALAHAQRVGQDCVGVHSGAW